MARHIGIIVRSMVAGLVVLVVVVEESKNGNFEIEILISIVPLSKLMIILMN